MFRKVLTERNNLGQTWTWLRTSPLRQKALQVVLGDANQMPEFMRDQGLAIYPATDRPGTDVERFGDRFDGVEPGKRRIVIAGTRGRWAVRFFRHG
jgi:hypothetical protein